MPAMYAHQHFGDVVYEGLPGAVRSRLDLYRDLYDIGLQGPDIFFYQDPVFWGRIPQYGNRLHEQSGHVFFHAALKGYYTAGGEAGAEDRIHVTDTARRGEGRAGDAMSAECQEAAEVYLYGVICHYSLDSVCHRYINEAAAAGGPSHAEQEGDFDRHLIEIEGRNPAKEDLSSRIHPSMQAAAVIEGIYPEVNRKEVLQAIRGCVRFQHLVRCPGDGKRTLFYTVLKWIGKYQSLSPHIIRKEPDPACVETTRQLDLLFAEAVPKAVRMILRLDAAFRMSGGMENCEAFLTDPDCDRTFDGVVTVHGAPSALRGPAE